jgi:hypothetical protein
MYHIGSQEELLVAVPEVQVGVNQQEIPAQEVQEAEKPGEELSECVDHQSSSFEKGKPQSITSLLLYKKQFKYICIYILLH